MSKEDYQELAEGISKAIGEEESPSSKILSAISSMNDDDFSDDDTNVANGFDDVLETYQKDFNSQSASEAGDSNTKHSKTCEGIDIKSNDSALGSEISFQADKNSSPTSDNKGQQSPDRSQGGQSTQSPAKSSAGELSCRIFCLSSFKFIHNITSMTLLFLFFNNNLFNVLMRETNQ